MNGMGAWDIGGIQTVGSAAAVANAAFTATSARVGSPPIRPDGLPDEVLGGTAQHDTRTERYSQSLLPSVSFAPKAEHEVEMRVNELLRATRTRPRGQRTEMVLTSDHVLWVDGNEVRCLSGSDLVAVLAGAPEITATDPVSRLDIVCSGHGMRAFVLAALQDEDPTAEFDESAWPDGTEDVPITDEWPADQELRHRWLTIDGGTYHLLPVHDLTRAVLVEEGEVLSGEEIASASWDFEGIGLSSVGRESLRIVGGDTLVRQDLGDDFPGLTIESYDGAPIAAVVRWLADCAYTPTYLVTRVPMPGLSVDERSALSDLLRQRVSVHVDDENVLDLLCATGEPSRFRRALANPSSAEGEQTYAFLRAIIAGDKPAEELLETLV